VLRWFCPLFLLTAMIANIALVEHPLYRYLLAAQGGFYTLAAVGSQLPGSGGATRLIRLSAMFVGMNLALAAGFWRWIRGRQSGVWKRTSRSLEPVGHQ
jgi:hypothetical protein